MDSKTLKVIVGSVVSSLLVVGIRRLSEQRESEMYERHMEELNKLKNSTDNIRRTLRVPPDSDAEEELMKNMKYTKDGVTCRLGAIFGWDYNEYDITQADINRIMEANPDKIGIFERSLRNEKSIYAD